MPSPVLQDAKLDNPQEWQLRDTATASNAQVVRSPLNPNPKGFQNQYLSRQTTVYEEENGSFSEEILQA